MKGLPAVVLLAMLTTLGSTLDSPPSQAASGGSNIGSAGIIIEKLGLVTALVIAVHYSTKRADKKEEELERREKAYHEAIQAKDKAINEVLVSVVKANTESLTRFQEQSKEMVDLMVRVTDRLGDFTAALERLQGNCSAYKPPQVQADQVPGFIRATPH